jgi:ribonuclease VapC
MSVVMDSSALLAVLLKEAGADKVISVLRGSAMSSVNLSEVYTKLLEANISIAEAQKQLERFELDIHSFDELHAARAAALRPITKHLGLSFGDRACLALAQTRALPILTADRDWAKLDIGVEIQLIR